MLAELLDTHKVDTEFMGKLLVAAIIVMALVREILATRRKPPVGEDLAVINAKIDAIKSDNDSHRALQAERHEENKEHLGGIAKRLAEGDKVMAELQKNQAVNSEAIQNIKGDIHEMKTTSNVIAAKLIQSSKRTGL